MRQNVIFLCLANDYRHFCRKSIHLITGSIAYSPPIIDSFLVWTHLYKYTVVLS